MKRTIAEYPGYRVLAQIHDDVDTEAFRAVRERDGVPVILKILKPSGVTPTSLSRFHNEYEVSRALTTGRTVKVYNLESHNQAVILVCEDFRGTRLDELMRQWWQSGTASISLIEILKIARQIVESLEDIHAAGVIYKDLHPSGIVLNPAIGELKLSDFGMATTVNRESPVLSNPQALKGALAYISPEQTGRMNRTVDYRTDFYSLGVIFFEMLTGRQPFETADAMELVHAHLARIPLAPRVLNPAIPAVLSDLVLKLMAKAPEDRYRSAKGIKQDLDRCVQYLEEKGEIPDFELGRQDRAERFIIPEKLYGRATEVASLLKAFDRTAQGRAELLLVTGAPGIGKTSVIAEIHNPIMQRNGYFVGGRFDQFKHDVPFSAFVEAIRDLIVQWISEGETRLAPRKRRILDAVGNTGQLIIDVIPELERVIGPQPPVPKLPVSAEQNRFNILFQKFVAALPAPEHPLAIFIDDLQWADWFSLELMQLLISRGNISHFLLLGAYRESDVSPFHPLIRTMAGLEKTGTPIRILTLGPLRMTDVSQLIADALDCSPEMALPLAELVYRITQGNPFFNNQLLSSLHEEGLIAFDREAGYWQCDLSQINKLSLTDDVVEFLAIRLQKLPESTQEVLRLAACIGNVFDLGTLASICRMSRVETVSNLWTAIQAGIILPQSDVARVFPHSEEAPVHSLDTGLATPLYGFLHERVQRAAYSLIPPEQKKATHLNIAQQLLENASEKERDERIFEIVNQFNRGIDLITDPAQRQRLAELNRKAGERAKAAIAYRAASDYFDIARRLLPEDSWERQYTFTLHLYESSVEAAYQNGDYAEANELAAVAMRNAKNTLDQIKAFEGLSEAFIAQGKFDESLDVGFRLLNELGVVYPRAPKQSDIDEALQEVKSAYSDETIEKLADLPLMKDPNSLAIARILSSISSPAFFTSPDLFTYLSLKDAHLAMKYGNTAAASFSYATYGQILCRGDDERENPILGYRFGQLGLDLLRRLDVNELQCKVTSVVHAFVSHWTLHVKDMLAPLRAAHQKGVEVGDFQFGGYSAFLYCAFSYFNGIVRNLSELRRETVPLNESIRQMKQMLIHGYFRMLQQALLDLGESNAPGKFFRGEYFDEETMLPRHGQLNDWIGLFYLHFHKLLLHCIFGQCREAVESAEQAKPFLKGMGDFPFLPVFCLYESLAHLAAQREDQTRDSAKCSRLIEANQAKLKTWAQYAPMNCLHKYDLVEAERFRNAGDRIRAIEAYDRAIAGAKENGYRREEALANELAASFFMDCGKEKIARAYMSEARRCYGQWGAHAKVAQLEQAYPQLLPTASFARSGTDSWRGETKTARRGAFSGLADTSLDLATVVKASQAMASEIELAPLLTQLMHIVIENAGAQRGALILERDGDWVVEAQGSADGREFPVLQSQKLQASGAVSAEIVYRVAQSRRSIVLDNASVSGDFTQDPYIMQRGIKSLLCAPLLNQGKLSGIVYLENNLTANAFTADRLELLNLLSAQIALSLDNARLYEKAQEDIAERKRVEAALRESEQRALTIFDSVNDGIIVHEIGTGLIVDANRMACEMHGYAREELLQLSVVDLGTEDSRRRNRPDEEFIRRRELQIFEWKAKDKQGREFWVEVSIKIANIGGIDRILVVVRNIAERKRIEAALQQSESVLRATMESISDGLLVIAEDGRILHCNNRFCEMWEIPENLRVPAENPRLKEYLVPQLADPDRFVQSIDEICRTSARSEDMLHLKDGRVFERFSYPLKRADGSSARVWLFRDVTERIRTLEQIKHMNEELEKRVAERTAALEAANRELEGFSYSVSHDLRAPLRAIDGYARIIVSDYAQLLNDEGKRFCGVIRGQAQRMSKLIDDLLAFSRLSRTGMNFVPVDMEALARTTFQEVTTPDQRARIDFRISALASAVGDPSLLRQIWINLISNAVKFTERQGKARIEVDAVQKDLETVYCVRDNGAGFDMRYVDKLFGVFQRLHSESEFEGTGVGLAIVQRVIHRHGGTVWAEGEVGKGAAFYFSLPHKGIPA